MGSREHTWLKSMQNGSIGEARTRAFLIDRFWILERSVDVDGADFIIQAKPANHEILSTILPRFCRIQAKFSQDHSTPIKLKRSYVVGPDDVPRDDFFLVIHTGDENSQKIFLLSAKDIIQKSFTRHDDFVIKLSSELQTTIISDKKRALDRIENSIKYVSFLQNRTYIFSNSLHVKAEFDSIIPEYKEDIEYGFGRISELFTKKKEKAFEHILRIEDLHEKLKSFIECVDPVEASLIAESIQSEFGYGYDDVYDEDLHFGAKRHLYEVTKLREDGALDNYISGRKRVKSSVEFFLSDKANIVIKGTVHTIKVTYNNENLFVEEIENVLSFNADASPLEFITCEPGNIIMSYRIGLFNGRVSNGGNWLSLMEKMIELKYYESN